VLPPALARLPVPSPPDGLALTLGIVARHPRAAIASLTMSVAAMFLAVATFIGLFNLPWLLFAAPTAFGAVLLIVGVMVTLDARHRITTCSVDPRTERGIVHVAIASRGRVTVTGIAHALGIPLAAADAALCALASSGYVTVDNDPASGVVVFVFPDVDAGLVPGREAVVSPSPAEDPFPAWTAPVRSAPPFGLVRDGNRTRATAVVLALVLGGFGAHKFYLGRPIIGLLYLVFVWTGIPVVLGILEAFGYLATRDPMFDLTYNARLA
jgi:TM2 domain-containing membrane protein YozV